MPIIDFKEIPEAHMATGNQDSFELFCQEFLKYMGLEVLSVPDRGADGGKDLICLEKRSGSFGSTDVKWMVSCKHKAHSGSSVTVSDEESIMDRITQHRSDGFIGFYSTVVSSSMNQRLNSYKDRFEIKIFNSEEIEESLLSSPRGKHLFKRFFPESYRRWYNQNMTPANVLSEYSPLRCHNCGYDLLNSVNSKDVGAIIGLIRDVEYSKLLDYACDKYVDIYFACKGNCDRTLEHRYTSGKGLVSEWKDLGDLTIPTEYLRWYIAILNNLFAGTSIFEEQAFEKLKIALISLSQYVMRDLVDGELSRLDNLAMLPEWLK